MTEKIRAENLLVPDCLSCAIVSGIREPSGGVVVETSFFNAHQDVAYPIPGCIIVAARRHVYGLDELSEGEATDLIRVMQRIRKAQREVLKIDHVYYFYNEDTTHHFHIWMVPRYQWMSEWGRSVQSLRPVLRYAKEHMNNPENHQLVREAVRRLKDFIRIN